jgi:hypothetical protein
MAVSKNSKTAGNHQKHMARDLVVYPFQQASYRSCSSFQCLVASMVSCASIAMLSSILCGRLFVVVCNGPVISMHLKTPYVALHGHCRNSRKRLHGPLSSRRNRMVHVAKYYMMGMDGKDGLQSCLSLGTLFRKPLAKTKCLGAILEQSVHIITVYNTP